MNTNLRWREITKTMLRLIWKIGYLKNYCGFGMHATSANRGQNAEYKKIIHYLSLGGAGAAV